MTISKNVKTRTLAAIAGLGIAGALAAGGAGLANAGTLPVTHPGEPSVAMTLTNHTDKTEWLASATPGLSLIHI